MIDRFEFEGDTGVLRLVPGDKHEYTNERPATKNQSTTRSYRIERILPTVGAERQDTNPQDAARRVIKSLALLNVGHLAMD